MRKIAVFVATTGGPVQVERLTGEHAPQSLICVRRSSTILDVSKDYDDFVRRGSGIIEREFGPFEYGSFRVDVSETIGAGHSWQLSLFLAHAIDADDGLALTDSIEEADEILWATGQVDYDLNVTAVEHIPQKIGASTEFFNGLKDDPGKVTIIFPKENKLGSLIDAKKINDFRSVPATNARALCKDLDLSLKDHLLPVEPPQKIKQEPKFFARRLIIGGAICLMVLLVWFYGQAPNRNETLSKVVSKKISNTVNSESPAKSIMAQPITAPDALVAEVAVLKPPPNGTCAKVAFAGIAPQIEPLKPDKEGHLPDRKLTKTCGLKFFVDPGKNKTFVALTLDVLSGFHLDASSRPEIFNGKTAFSDGRAWELQLPRRLPSGYAYNLVILFSEKPISDRLSNGKRFIGDPAEQKLPEHIKRIIFRHKVTP